MDEAYIRVRDRETKMRLTEWSTFQHNKLKIQCTSKVLDIMWLRQSPWEQPCQTTILFTSKPHTHPQGRRSLWDRGDMYPQYLWRGGDIHGNVPTPNIFEVMSFSMSTRVTATVVCCILMQSPGKGYGGRSPPYPLPGLCPWTPLGFWGTEVPQNPSLLLCPPNNPVRSTPLHTRLPALLDHYRSSVIMQI